MPKGPQGRYAPFLPFLWGVWKFSKNKPAAKSLLAHLLQRPNVERIVNASGGYDIPSFESMRDFRVWEQVEPPKGTVYHYPPRTQVTWMAGAPAPANIAQQMYVQAINTKMIARCTQGGDSIDKTIGWAASELEATCARRRAMANGVVQAARLSVPRRRRSGRRLARHKSTIAFLMALPLMALIAALVIYPALYSLHLATLNKSMERFVGLGNFAFLFKRELFWMVIKQTVIFAVSAVIFRR